MTTENIICVKCEDLLSELTEKEEEIKKLKIHIHKLTNYMLGKGNVSDIKLNTKYDFDTNKSKGIETSLHYDELFNTSCDILKQYIFQESKSTQTEKTGISDILKDTGDKEEKESKSEVGNLNGYVYDENYQMYYNVSTGYYYDEKSGLMYEPQSCTYYRYNYDKEEYENVSQENSLDLKQNEDNVCRNGKEVHYNCDSVVEQVSNLNLNDDLVKVENFHAKTENVNTLEAESSINEHKKENYETIDLALSEDEHVSLGCAQEWKLTEGSNLTITDIVKQVVDEHNNMSDYIFDETNQMYYSPSTGYFFDSVRNLLYDPTSGTYYFYDTDKQTYEFYCQADLNANNKSKSSEKDDSVHKERLACRKLYWKKKLERSKETSEALSDGEICEDVEPEDNEEFSSPEDGEIFSSDEEVSIAPVCIVKSPVKGVKQKSGDDSYPPSIRAIVENSENLQIGSLILITCSGGIIGRDKVNAVYIPDVCVSKLHAEIKFNFDFQTYSIEDLGSQNGTFINEKRLSEPKVKSEPCLLSHGDKLSLGSCRLLLHIHDGHDTCDNCEPGQVLAEISSNIEKNAVLLTKEEKEKLRREELRRLKQKYGLQRIDFERKTTSKSQGYEDKSEIRRQTIGSDNPYEKTQEASVDVSMPETNKGYQMLKKMGWKEGQTLGATESGLVEPIPLRAWTSKAGLGSVCNSAASTSFKSLQEDRKKQRWVKARERYFQLSLVSDASTEPQTDQKSNPT